MNELVQRAQQGDDRAFIQLFERHKLELWKTATAVLNNPDDAADALQDTVLKAWRAIPGFEGRSAVGTWLNRHCTGYPGPAHRIRRWKSSFLTFPSSSSRRRLR